MPLLLSIDTALETASICVSFDEQILSYRSNSAREDHAGWLHVAIRDMMQEAGKELTELNAVAVSIGPGSFTGLRVGLSSAKGFCYALNIPLITVGTLEMMAFAVKNEIKDLAVPLIDARRMEVFTAVYDKDMTEVEKPFAMTLTKDSFSSLLDNQHITFSGSGINKLRTLISHPNAFFSTSNATAKDLAEIAAKYLRRKQFADLAYSEPLYGKEFYAPGKAE